MSDRAILTRFLPLREVGVYALGYQLGAAMGLLTNAFNAAWVPFLFGALKEEGEAAHPRLARLVSYYAFVLCFVGLGWTLMVPHAMWHESAQSFLGLGLPTHTASLGTLIQGARGALLAGQWWPTLFPGLFIIVPTLALAGLTGAWRERINPRRRSELML